MTVEHSESAPYVLEAQALRKRYGDVTAVDGITFNVRRGELFGLLGPNGAGKTTTIRMVYGFSPVDGGSLRVFGMDITRDWRAIRARLGICHQENNLDPDLPVRANLEMFARYYGMPRAIARTRIDHLLQFIGLEQRADARTTELSGGMMRRLILARALLNEPDMIILDEPTTGLDPQSRHLVWERLRQLKAQGITILLTTHYMEEASQLCDRLIIIDHGRILAEGTPADLVHKYVGREIIECSPVTGDLRGFIVKRGLEHEDLGHKMVIYGAEDEGLFRAIRDGFCHESCVLRVGTLEDVFLKLTGRELRE